MKASALKYGPCREHLRPHEAVSGAVFRLFLLKPGGMALYFRACGVCIQPPVPPLIKILITDAAYFVAGGKEFSFSEQCLFFGVAGVIMMRSFWFVFFPWRNFFFLRGRSTVLKMQFHELIIVQ